MDEPTRDELIERVRELESEVEDLEIKVDSAEERADDAEQEQEAAEAEVERLEAERAQVVELWQEARRVGSDGWARAELDRLLEPNPVLRGE